MRPSASASLFLASLPLVLALASCGKDRDLAPTTTSTGTGGSGAGGAGGSTSSGDTGGGATTTTTIPEPAGPTKLTIVNGINDYDAIRVCFVPYPGAAQVDPWPASPAGLAFGKAIQVDPPSSLAPGGTDVQPHVLAGDLSAIAGMSCDEALALAASGSGSGGTGGATGSGGSGGAGGTGGSQPPPPPIVVSPMPVVPATVFQEEKSLLLAFFGCMGGPGHADGTEGLGCGFAYTPEAPTASLTLVAMSRIQDPSKVSLQFLHASTAMPTSDIRIAPGFDNVVDVPVVKSIALGGLAPKPPFAGLARADYGSLPKVAIKTFAPNSAQPTSTVLLQDAFTNGGIDTSTFENGSNFTIVAVGGYPGVAIPSFWHHFTYVMLPSDPE